MVGVDTVGRIRRIVVPIDDVSPTACKAVRELGVVCLHPRVEDRNDHPRSPREHPGARRTNSRERLLV